MGKTGKAATVAKRRRAGAQRTKAKILGQWPSLRSWLALHGTHGQLRRIKAEVDWDQEIAGIARVNLDLGGPGLPFEATKGYRKGRCTKFLTRSTGNRMQVCLLASIPPKTSDRAPLFAVSRTCIDAASLR